MARKGSISRKKKPPVDPKYKLTVVAKFINSLMYDGKKSKAEKIFYESLDVVAEKTGKDAIEVFNQAMSNVRPTVEVRPRRVGGATYQVPIEVNTFRRQSLTIRWLIGAAKKGPGKSMIEKLSAEILEAAEGRGGAIKKREEAHRMAEANRAFAHYRW